MNSKKRGNSSSQLDNLSVKTSGNRRVSATGWALLFFALALGVSVFFTGWDDAVNAISELSITQILALYCLALAHYFIRALRWHMMVRTGGVEIHWALSLLHFFGGFAMTATPGRVGELIRLRWLMRVTGRGFGHLLPIAFSDRAIELASMVGLISVCLAAANLGSPAVLWVLAVGMALVWIACRPAALLFVVNSLWSVMGRRARFFVKLRRLTRRLRPFMHVRVFGPVLVLGMIGWSFEGFAFWLLLSWFGAEITLPAAAAIFLVSVLSGALSGLPGGLGGTEATAIALLALQGVAFETAVLTVAIIRIATLWFAVVLGFVFFPIAEARRC